VPPLAYPTLQRKSSGFGEPPQLISKLSRKRTSTPAIYHRAAGRFRFKSNPFAEGAEQRATEFARRKGKSSSCWESRSSRTDSSGNFQRIEMFVFFSYCIDDRKTRSPLGFPRQICGLERLRSCSITEHSEGEFEAEKRKILNRERGQTSSQGHVGIGSMFGKAAPFPAPTHKEYQALVLFRGAALFLSAALPDRSMSENEKNTK